MKNRIPRSLAFAVLSCALYTGAYAQQAQTLTLAQSMALAVQNNISVKLAALKTDAARAETVRSAAGLLPHLTASVGQTRTFRENLEAAGFAGYGYIGPFNSFDARLSLVQEIFNWNTYSNYHSQKQREQSIRLQQDLAAEQVSAAAALSYVEVLRSDAALDAAKADERLAAELLNLAQERHSAGTATGLDVAREKTRVAQEHSRVLYAQVACDSAQLRLNHVTGEPMDREYKLSDSLEMGTTEIAPLKPAIATAFADRLELAVGKVELRAADYAAEAARAGHLPTLAVTGAFAISGITPEDHAGSVGDMGVQLRLPLFEGGAVSAAADKAQAEKQQIAARLEDMDVQVEQDVRLSLKQLAAAVEQVQTAQEAVTLALSELEMAQGRFSAGVGDNVELVNAQTSLSEARSARVAALAQYNNSKINFALAQGHMRAFSLR